MDKGRKDASSVDKLIFVDSLYANFPRITHHGNYVMVLKAESEQALGDGEGQGSLACYSPWGGRVGHSEPLNNN